MIQKPSFFFRTFSLLVMGAALSPRAQAQLATVSLNSSSQQVWKVTPQADVTDKTQLLKAGYAADKWVEAVVPGTVFTSYVKAGLEKDPNFGDNIYKVDRAKYDRPFWYRTEFTVPGSFTKEKTWLCFKGVNRKADVYLNGEKIGTLNGFMDPNSRFDITAAVQKKEKNVLALLVSIPEAPLANYGSPTYISSGSWDWMPYVPGLNAGITDKVYLSNTGGMQIEHPWIRTLLPSNARADLEVAVGIRNASAQYLQGELTGTIQPGNIHFSKKIGVEANRITELKLDKKQLSELVIDHPKLWWPNGYGDPNLYTCDFRLTVGDQVSDSQRVVFGVKRYTYDTLGNILHVSINGTRVFIKGGNWGMSEYLLRCRGSEYDTKVRLHKEMNFNMIRNWLGSTTDEEFYEACDKYGMMVWDDFWLNSNPVLPSDIHAFNANSIEKIQRFRNHPSIAVWCGNNEGWPEPPLNKWLRENIATYDAGDRYYQPNSHEENLSGSGLWGNHDPRWYFTPYPTSLGGARGWGLRTETGTAVFPNFESLKKFMPEDKLWPRNEMWNQHFFGQLAFNATPDYYDASIDERYGKPKGIEEYCRKAQLLNIETNKAMYEGWLDHMWEDASGIMTWMSQSAYPSMVWQTYDYYYDLTGAYWGAKSACEPLHILWNSLTNSVKVINTTHKDAEGLTAEATVYNMDGKEVSSLHATAAIDAPYNSATHCFTLPFNLNPVNLALNKPVTASSTESGRADEVTDGNSGSRWASKSSDREWIYVDLGKPTLVNAVGLNWESAYAKSFKIQVSDDASSWKDVYSTNEGREGKMHVDFDDVTARYVRMQGVERGSWWGYSLWDFEVYGGDSPNSGLTDVHFIRLKLTNKEGRTVSENTYWRGSKRKDFTALSTLPKVTLKTTTQVVRRDGKCFIQAKITNPAAAPAFAVWVQARNAKTRERILPAVMSDNYFLLLKGETKEVTIECDEELLPADETALITAEPYNNSGK